MSSEDRAVPSSEDRRAAIIRRLAAWPGDRSSAHLCTVAMEVVGVSGAGVMLMSGDVAAGRACSSDAVASAIEDLQFTLGEGPCLDAYHFGSPVLEADLASGSRWPAFTPAAVAAGARAIFGFPLQIGAAKIGALNLYRDRSGPLDDEQHADALLTAEILSRALLALQAEAPPGVVAAEIERGGDLLRVVHEATGMVAAQLEVSVAEALVRLRAHAFGSERALVDVATDVVARRLRFTDDH